MQKIFLISDLHLGHERIIKYENRPFKDKYEQDEVIIKNWNNIIKKEYEIFVLGDVSFYPKEKTKEIITSLNGRKTLILGNHDRGHSVQYWKDVGFENVSKYPICIKDFYWLSHEPMYINDHMPYINCHGHTHHVKYDNAQYYNVSVECINYKPISFEKIEEIINECFVRDT